MKPKTPPWKYDPDPMFACEVAPDGGVLTWMAFDPIYGPETEAQIDWHRRRHGDRFVRGWKVGEPLPGTRPPDWRRENLAEVDQVADKPKFAALESHRIRHIGSGEGSGTPEPFCVVCGAQIAQRQNGRKLGRKTRADVRYCSSRCRQQAYRLRQTSLFEEAPAG